MCTLLEFRWPTIKNQKIEKSSAAVGFVQAAKSARRQQNKCRETAKIGAGIMSTASLQVIDLDEEDGAGGSLQAPIDVEEDVAPFLPDLNSTGHGSLPLERHLDQLSEIFVVLDRTTLERHLHAAHGVLEDAISTLSELGDELASQAPIDIDEEGRQRKVYAAVQLEDTEAGSASGIDIEEEVEQPCRSAGTSRQPIDVDGHSTTTSQRRFLAERRKRDDDDDDVFVLGTIVPSTSHRDPSTSDRSRKVGRSEPGDTGHTAATGSTSGRHQPIRCRPSACCPPTPRNAACSRSTFRSTFATHRTALR